MLDRPVKKVKRLERPRRMRHDLPMKPTLALLIGLSAISCSSRPQPAAPPPRPQLPAVAPRPPVAVAAPQSESWQDWPLSPGDWAYRKDERGSVALFGKVGQDADFVARCDRSRSRVYLSRAGAFAAGDTGRMTVRASTALQTYPVANAGGTPAYIAAELSTTDPQLDAIAFSRGKFLISVKGGSDLVIPAWAELARVVEDCR